MGIDGDKGDIGVSVPPELSDGRNKLIIAACHGLLGVSRAASEGSP